MNIKNQQPPLWTAVRGVIRKDFPVQDSTEEDDYAFFAISFEKICLVVMAVTFVGALMKSVSPLVGGVSALLFYTSTMYYSSMKITQFIMKHAGNDSDLYSDADDVDDVNDDDRW